MDALTIVIALLTLIIGAVGGFLFGRRGQSGTAAEPDARALTDARQDAATARAEASRAREESAIVKAEIAQHLADKADLRTLAEEARRLVAEAHAETSRVAANVAALTAERDAAREKAATTVVNREEPAPQAPAQPAAPAALVPTAVMAGKKCTECGAHAVIRKDGCEYCTACGAVGSCG